MSTIGRSCTSHNAGGDRPFLISGADDKLVKVWDYQTKACVTTLEVRGLNQMGPVLLEVQRSMQTHADKLLHGAYIMFVCRATNTTSRRPSSTRSCPSSSRWECTRGFCCTHSGKKQRWLRIRRCARYWASSTCLVNIMCAWGGCMLWYTGFGGRHGQGLAQHHLPSGEHPGLPYGARVEPGLCQGLQLVRNAGGRMWSLLAAFLVTGTAPRMKPCWLAVPLLTNVPPVCMFDLAALPSATTRAA